MAMIERERYVDVISLGKFALPFKMSRMDVRGPAALSFPEGRSTKVDATATTTRSVLSLSGEGQLRCASDVGFDAVGLEDWATLTFSCGTTLFIDVYDLKAYSDGSCRCLFEVVG